MSTNRLNDAGLLARLAGAVRLVHPFPALTVVLTACALLAVAHRGFPGWPLLLRAGGVVAMSQVAVGALNDYVDRHDDAIEGRSKPIPEGLVSPSMALLLVIAGLLGVVVLAATFGPGPLMLALLGTAAGLVYDLRLKPTPASFVGYVIGFLALVSWIWLVAGHFSPWIIAIYPAGAIGVITAHLAQSLPDVESDRRLEQSGLAVLLGPVLTVRLILLLYTGLSGAALLLIAATRSTVALPPIALAALLCGFSWRLRTSALCEGAGRVLLFRLVAPGIALLGAGCLIAIGSL